MYSAQPDSFELLLRRAEETVAMRSIHIVEDAITYARWLLSDGLKMREENTQLKRKLDELSRR
jgi:hypothetical protein